MSQESVPPGEPALRLSADRIEWRGERSNRVQPQRVEVSVPGGAPWRVSGAPWWLRCRTTDRGFQLAVRNCGRQRGTVRLHSEVGEAALPVESEVRPTPAAATRGAALGVVSGGAGMAASIAGSDELYDLTYRAVLTFSGGWLTGSTLAAQAVVMAAMGLVCGAAIGAALGGPRLVVKSGAGGALGGLAAGVFCWALVGWLYTTAGAQTDLLFLLLGPIGMWILVGTAWGGIVGGRWLGLRAARVGLAAALLAIPVGIGVSAPWAAPRATFSAIGYDPLWIIFIPATGFALFSGFLGALIAPCRLPK